MGLRHQLLVSAVRAHEEECILSWTLGENLILLVREYLKYLDNCVSFYSPGVIWADLGLILTSKTKLLGLYLYKSVLMFPRHLHEECGTQKSFVEGKRSN